MHLHDPIDTPRIVVETRTFAGIHSLVARPDVAHPLPTVLYYHGWGSSVESFTFLATVLAQQGFVVVMPEVPLHGQRGALDNYFDPAGYVKYWDAVLEAIEEVPHLYTALRMCSFTDANRVGLVGNSMGGQIAAGAFVRQSEFKALVCANSTPHFVEYENWCRKQTGRPPVEGADHARLQGYDPSCALDALRDRPVLFLHGIADSTMPVALTKALHEEIETSTLHMYPKVNHQLTFAMFEELVHDLKLTL